MVPKRIRRRTFKLNKGVVSLSMLSVVLFEVEQLLGEEFRCPQGQVLGVTYSLLYFLMPALVWFILGLRMTCGSGASCQHGMSSHHATCFSSCFLPFFRACILPTVWVLFLLRDGRYDECIVDSLLYEDPTAKPDTQNPALYSLYYTYIQMAAIVAIGLLIIIALLLTWRCSEASDPTCLRLLCCCCPACAKESCKTSLGADGYMLEVTEEVEIKVLYPA